MLNYTPGPTGGEFLSSRAFLKLAMGPVGGGKSTVALFDLYQRALNQVEFGGVRRTKFGILRNTMQQLKATVKPLLDTWFVEMPTRLGGYPMGEWKLTDNTFVMKFKLPDGTIVHSDFLLLPADTPDDVRRLLSLELSAAWVEECREVVEEVFDGLQGRVARFPSRAAGGVTYPGVICSTNPPPLGTFWHTFITTPPETAEIFIQPAAMLEDGSWNPEAENREHLHPDYYDNLVAGKKSGWIDVYIRNQFGPGEWGNPIFKGSYKREFHTSKTTLSVISQSLNPLLVGMDNGLQAAAVIGQQDMRGRVNVLGECYVPEDQTMGVESFLDKLLIPMLRSRFPQISAQNTVFVLDPACFARSQVDEKTIAQAVQNRGFTVVRASSNDPERRIDAVEGLLNRQIDGGAGLLLDPSCTYLAQALEWGYRYKKTQAGQGTLTPEKNHFSHLSDAFQYLSLHYNLAQSAGAMAGRRQARPVVKSTYVYA